MDMSVISKSSQTSLIHGINHVNLSVENIECSFDFYHKVMGFTPLCQSEGSAYFLAGKPEEPGSVWVSLDLDRNQSRINSPCNTHIAFSVDADNFDEMSQRILDSGATLFKDNTSEGKSLYFCDPDGHKLEIHVGSWRDRILFKKQNPGNWKNIKWYI